MGISSSTTSGVDPYVYQRETYFQTHPMLKPKKSQNIINRCHFCFWIHFYPFIFLGVNGTPEMTIPTKLMEQQWFPVVPPKKDLEKYFGTILESDFLRFHLECFKVLAPFIFLFIDVFPLGTVKITWQDPLFKMLQGRFGRLVRGLKKWICVARGPRAERSGGSCERPMEFSKDMLWVGFR